MRTWCLVVLIAGCGAETPDEHRQYRETCDSFRASTMPEVIDEESCSQDADCEAGANGRCSFFGGAVSDLFRRCTYDECTRDGECAEGPCACGGDRANRCLAGNCQVDLDCGSDGYCIPSFGCLGQYANGYYCDSPGDECHNDRECGDDHVCAYDETRQHFACIPRCVI